LIAFSASILMLLLAAGASLMRGGRYIHADADGSVHHDSVAEAIAREGDALAVPAVPDEEVAYDEAVTGRGSR
jgi:hypothetical protein